MSTHSGGLDPGLAPYLERTEQMTTSQFYKMVNHESGLVGVSETSSEMRDLLAREAADVRAAEAVALSCYQAKKWIGACAAGLGGHDSLVVLFGVVDDDGVVMSTYLEQIFDKATLYSVQDIRDAVLQAGLKRIGPCLVIISTLIFGLLPIFWATGRGSGVMQPMAIPSVGEMVVSLVGSLFISSLWFCAVEAWKWRRAQLLALKAATA